MQITSGAFVVEVWAHSWCRRGSPLCVGVCVLRVMKTKAVNLNITSHIFDLTSEMLCS